MAKQDSLKNAAETTNKTAKATSFKKAAEKVKVVNFMKEFNDRDMFGKGGIEK